MRVESCGPLFAEPKQGDIFFPGHRLSEPITIINPKNNLLGENEDGFLKFDRVAADTIVGQTFEPEQQHPLPIGFFLTEEEWSLFKQPQLGVEPYEQGTMNNLSLPKSYTPFNSSPSTSEIGQDSSSKIQTPDSQWPNNFNHLSETFVRPSVQVDEPNNNLIVEDISTLQQIKTQAALEQQQPEWNPQDINGKGNDNENDTGIESTSELFHEASQDLPFDVHSISVSLGGGGGLGSYFRAIPPVDTIASHSQPITSTLYGHNHTHHQHYPPLPAKYSCQQWGEPPVLDTRDYFEDWQSQSTFLSTEVDKAKLAWNQVNDLNQQWPSMPLDGPLQQTSVDKTVTKPVVPSDEVDFANFLSKFNNEVAAIWGGGGAQANYQDAGAAYGATMPYSEGYLSTSSTPISGNMYPWASPSSDQTHGNYYYGLRVMKNHLEEQQRHLAQAQNRLLETKSSNYENNLDKNIPKEPVHFKPAVATPQSSEVDPCTMESFEEECAIMQSLKQHFGVAPSKEDYFILKSTGADSSVEEKEKSLAELNHDDQQVSSFQRYAPTLGYEPSISPYPVSVPNSKFMSSDKDIKAMQESFQGLELDNDEDNGINLDLEVATILKENPKTYIEQPLHVDLFRSWKTHFTPIEVLEKDNGYGLATPPNLFSQEINPQLPQYRLFAGNEKEYNVYFRTAKTSFPIRFKLRPDNAKSVQTENPNVALASKNEAIMRQEQELFSNRACDFDWEPFGNGSGSDYNFNLSSGTRTPMTTESRSLYDFNLEGQQEWLPQDGTIFGGGSSVNFDYGSFATDTGNMIGQPFPQSDFCCDSGIGIDASSRAGFYDDAYTDYGDFDFSGGLNNNNEEGGAYVGYTENDVDYGQFQGLSYNTWSTSSASGKTSKSHRRRTKMKPCKYFLLEGSCKRGQNCKFSHDLTTCRYWAEGSCLKGDACPYLHCFVERNPYKELENYRYGGKRYHLESENDFPTLSGDGGTKENTLLSSQEQVSVDYPQFTQGINVNAGSSAESLLVLADPAGSVYDGFAYGLYPENVRGFSMPVMPPMMGRSGKGNKKQQDQNAGKKRNGKSLTDNGWSRQGRNNNNGNNTNNNNWISSMISVKEKRRKKKPTITRMEEENILQLCNDK